MAGDRRAGYAPNVSAITVREIRVHEAIESRRSIRRYTSERVWGSQVEAVLEAARLAPSGSNTQPWRFIVIRSDSQREAVAKVSHDQKWMMGAPVFIACVGAISSRIPDYDGPPLDELSDLPELKQVIRDTSIAVEHLVLRATELGLGTCWVAWFTQDEIRPVLGVPDDNYVLAVITLGHPAQEPKSRSRHALEDIVFQEQWPQA